MLTKQILLLKAKVLSPLHTPQQEARVMYTHPVMSPAKQATGPLPGEVYGPQDNLTARLKSYPDT